MIVASAVPVHYTVPSGAFLLDVPVHYTVLSGAFLLNVPVHYTLPSGAFLLDVPRAPSEHPRAPVERQVRVLLSYPTSNGTPLRSAAILFLKQSRHKH